MIPMRIVSAIMYAIPTYFLAGFQVHAGKFFIFLLTLIMATVPATAMAVWTGNLTSNAHIAYISVAMIYRISFLFGGMLIRLDDIPVWLRWLQYLSIFKYGFSNLTYNELRGLTFDECGSYRNETCEMSGDMYLQSQGIVGGSELIWTNIGALAAITVVFLSLAFIMLRRINTSV